MLAVWSEGRYSVSVFARADEQRTRVQITAHVEAYERTMTHRWHACASNGTIEHRLYVAIGNHLTPP